MVRGAGVVHVESLDEPEKRKKKRRGASESFPFLREGVFRPRTRTKLSRDKTKRTVVRDVKRPVRVHVQLLLRLPGGRRRAADKAPHGQVVQEQLEPEVVPHRPRQALCRVRVEHLRADALLILGNGLEEPQLELRVDQAVALEHLAEPDPLPRRLLAAAPFAACPGGALPLRAAERQRIVVVGLLRVVVGPDLVDPEAEGVAALVLYGTFFCCCCRG